MINLAVAKVGSNVMSAGGELDTAFLGRVVDDFAHERVSLVDVRDDADRMNGLAKRGLDIVLPEIRDGLRRQGVQAEIVVTDPVHGPDELCWQDRDNVFGVVGAGAVAVVNQVRTTGSNDWLQADLVGEGVRRAIRQPE